VWSVLLASYESMRRFGGELAGCCDLLICDEGHRRVFFGRGWRLGMGYGLWWETDHARALRTPPCRFVN
jgi:hypothetical protein